MPWVRNLMQPLESRGPRTEHWGTFQQRRAHDCHCREHGTILVITSSKFEVEQVQNAPFSISSTKSFLLERSGYKVLLPENKERAFGPLPYQKKEDWTGVILPSINCLFPPCPKKEAPELIAFCGQPEEGEGNKVQVCLSRGTWSYTRILCGLHQVTTLLVAGKSSGWSLMGHQGAVSHVWLLYFGEKPWKGKAGSDEEASATGWAERFPSRTDWSLSLRSAPWKHHVSRANLLLDQFSSQRKNLPQNSG